MVQSTWSPTRYLIPLQVATQQHQQRLRNFSNAASLSASFQQYANNPNKAIWVLMFCGLFGLITLGMGGYVISGIQKEQYGTYGETSPELVHPQEKYKFYYKKQMMSSNPINWEELRGPNGPKWTVLVTGAAGFVGMHTALELKRLGMNPIGYDNVNSYYSTELKQLRIAKLKEQQIPFIQGDVCDRRVLRKTLEEYKITRIIHLAAQAGVRYSLNHPMEYTQNNIDCTVHLLEVFVQTDMKRHGPLVYASSSSVYGNNIKVPFQETDRVEDPASLYAATKRSDELIAQTYWNLYNISSIGLRFFTVYGPFGRPDMAPWIFTDKISSGQTIKVFNHGLSQRDFTYVDDIVQGVVNSLYPTYLSTAEIVNLGNGRPIVLADFVNIVEQSVGKAAVKEEVGMQKGDVPVTYADITKARQLLGYQPSTKIEDGIPEFVRWFRQYNATKYRME